MAVEVGAKTIALTNINSNCDVWDFVKTCQQAGVKPVVGAEIRNEDELLYIVIAANNTGLSSIHEFLSDHLINKKKFPRAPDYPVVFKNNNDGFVIYPLAAKPIHELRANESIGILPWEAGKLLKMDWRGHEDKFVIRQPVTFQNRAYFNLHRLLRAISKNCLLSKLPNEAQASKWKLL